jgi:Lhr-like helicase
MRCGAASWIASSFPANAFDVLAQQITAEVAAREWSEDALFELLRGAYAYRRTCGEKSSTIASRMLARRIQHAPRAPRRAHSSRYRQ